MASPARSVEARSILNRATGFLSGFSHTLNPYRGCAFGAHGCGVYCYVAESPAGRFGRGPWGTWVDAKVNAAELLARALPRLDPGATRIYLGSATDPYQGAEARLGITRSLLAVFARRPVALLVVQTRSPLVTRDLDLLAALPFAWLSMTVETDDDTLRRALTPTAPAIPRRLAAMRAARAAGIRVQAAVSPLLPHDRDRFVDLLEGAADRVVVDTLTSGDGAGGARSARRPLPGRLAALGFGDWRDESGAHALHGCLVDRLGPSRVGWSADGFAVGPPIA